MSNESNSNEPDLDVTAPDLTYANEDFKEPDIGSLVTETDD